THLDRDPVIEQIARELGRLQASATKNGVRAEHVHGFASQVRVLLMHAKATGLDARVEEGFGTLIDANGRDTIIDTEVDRKVLDAQLAAFGINASDAPIRLRPERDKRSALLNSLLVGGITPTLEQLSAALVRAEEKADRMGAAAIPMQRTSAALSCSRVGV